MITFPPLAFVDLETTGFSANSDRITEIGVVTVDNKGVNEWTTLINPGTHIAERSRLFNGIGDDVIAAAPRFKDIALDLYQRLAGRLFIAHNARFDFGFLRVEFQRIGIEFQPQVLCSVMLSRKLYLHFAAHDLDTLMRRHGLKAEIRHRALPDARLVWQFWKVMHDEHPHQHISKIIEALLAGPVLPEHLDPSLIDRLPEAPGIYFLHGDAGQILHVGKAGNLKLHLLSYFRIDRTSKKALAISLRVTNITWRVTRGEIGAHLQWESATNIISPVQKRRAAAGLYSWQLVPHAYPCLELVALADGGAKLEDCYGRFGSERKARNALLRVTIQKGICQALVGVGEVLNAPCTRCAGEDSCPCVRKKARLQHLTKVVAAFESWRLRKWPYDGPIGVRERSDLHIIEDWRYLGTAQNDAEIHSILETRPNGFDEGTFAFLSKKLRHLPSRRIVRLQRRTTLACENEVA
jgi:DNA polymerase-3 subunit epsilon